MRDAVRTDQRVDADRLVDRVEALRRFIRTVEGHLPSERLVRAQTVVERAGVRLALSRDHTVVALAGSTGSGKSSLFNALARLDLSPVGVLRPTTGVAHSCVWGPLDPARRLLDWVGVLPRNRFLRESALDGDDEASLHGLILLDLPDFDSVEKGHRLEVDRLLGLVDLVVWVLDPQKYADRVVHQSYLREFHRLAGVTVVVLNQADRLSAVDLTRLLADLRRLLERDELPDVPVLATSAVDPNGHTELRALLEETVAARHAALERLNGDVDQAVAGLSDVVGPPAPREMVDRGTVRGLTDALASSAGVPAVVAATGRAYRLRATAATGWPLVRWLGRLRPDPLRRLHLPQTAQSDAPLSVTSVPDPDEAQRAAVGLAVRAVAGQAARELPAPWPAAVTAAARSRLDDVPDVLDRAVAGTDLGMHRAPAWWRVAGTLQWLATLAAIGGLGWLLAGYAVRALGLPALEHPKVGEAPWPTLLLLGGLLLGVLLALLVKPLVRLGSRRAARRADTRLRAAVTEVAREYVVAPVREALHAYEDAREQLAAAGRT